MSSFDDVVFIIFALNADIESNAVFSAGSGLQSLLKFVNMLSRIYGNYLINSRLTLLMVAIGANIETRVTNRCAGRVFISLLVVMAGCLFAIFDIANRKLVFANFADLNDALIIIAVSGENNFFAVLMTERSKLGVLDILTAHIAVDISFAFSIAGGFSDYFVDLRRIVIEFGSFKYNPVGLNLIAYSAAKAKLFITLAGSFEMHFIVLLAVGSISGDNFGLGLAANSASSSLNAISSVGSGSGYNCLAKLVASGDNLVAEILHRAIFSFASELAEARSSAGGSLQNSNLFLVGSGQLFVASSLNRLANFAVILGIAFFFASGSLLNDGLIIARSKILANYRDRIADSAAVFANLIPAFLNLAGSFAKNNIIFML